MRIAAKRSYLRVFPLLAAFALLGAALVVPAASAQVPGDCPPKVITEGNWYSINAPKFGDGGQSIAAHAPDPLNQYLIYVTNGTEVWRTGDAGCTWKKVYGGADAVLPGLGTATIEQIVVPKPGSVVLRMQSTQGPGVVVSEESGNKNTWVTGGTGLPPAGDIEFLETVDINPLILYAGIDQAGGAVDLLYQSTDGGVTFLLKSDLTKTVPQAGIIGLEADPINADRLWLYGSGGLYDSFDGGASITQKEQLANEIVSEVDTFHVGGDPARVLVFTPEKRRASLSIDGGKNYYAVEAPLGVDSAVSGMNAGSVMIAAGGSAYLYDPAYKVFNRMGCPTPACRAVSATRGLPVNFLLHTDRTIERYEAAFEYQDVGYGIDVPPLQETADETLGRSAFAPGFKKIVLDPGESRTVPYRLLVPRTPVPMDVYFLVDTSNSMTQPLEGMVKSLALIAQGLESKGIDVQFGLAEYRSYPDSAVPRPSCDGAVDESRCEKNFIYKQRGDIGTPLPQLQSILESLRPEAGGYYDAHLSALYQTATGEGEDVYPRDSDPNGTDVPQGLEAAWRSVSEGLNVVIHASDEAFGQRGPDRDNFDGNQVDNAPPPEIPSFAEVIAALNERHAKHVGIAIGNVEGLMGDMRKVSKGTDTTAKSKVDCDSDGDFDLAPGDPLVCRIPPNESDRAATMVPAIIRLLDEIREGVSVNIAVDKGARVVSSVTPKAWTNVILQSSHDLDFKMRFHCPRALAGEKTRVRVQPILDGAPFDELSAEALVVCREAPPEFIPPSVSPLIAIAVIPGVPPPPAPISNAQPASQSQAQAQGAAAQQEQEEPQLAIAAADDGLQEEEMYAMSRYDRRSPSAEGAFGLGVVAVSLMYGAGLSLRRRYQAGRNYR